MFTKSEIEKNRILERTKAQITAVAKDLISCLEEKGNFEMKKADTLCSSISKLCPDFGFHLSLHYERIYETYYEQTVLPCLKNKRQEDLVQELYQRMLNHNLMVALLSEIFDSLNKFLALSTSWSPNANPLSWPRQVFYNRELCGTKIRNLEDLAMLTFRDQVLLKINTESRACVMKMIAEEREGIEIDRELLKNVLVFYVRRALEVYKQHFEIFFLQETTSYYASKASSWLEEYSCPEYMIEFEESVKKEKDRVTHYLHSDTEPKLVEIMQTQLLVLPAKQLLDKEPCGYRALLRDDKKEQLSKMYRLYHAIPKGLEPVAEVFRVHVATEGSTLIKEAEDSANNGSVDEQGLVKKIIDLHDKYLLCVTDCFQSHILFHTALTEAFESFCSKKVAGTTSAELLATFLDNRLKVDKWDEDTVSIIDKVVKLIDYINDKDLFVELYRKKVAHSLLFDQSGVAGHDITIVLEKLKEHFGSQFTKSMDRMVIDMELAKGIQTSFMEKIQNGEFAKREVDFSAKVLTSSYWPTLETSNINLPVEMVKSVEAFNAFYKKTTRGRTLTWVYSLGRCIVAGRFDSRSIDLVVSTYQAAVLCIFNEAEKLTYHEIIEQVKLSHEDLSRVLLSLSCLEYEILKKEPASQTISETDSFKFNSKFTHTQRRINVPLPPLAKQEKVVVVEEVVKDRPAAIDACLVKIMKEKKKLLVQELIATCVERLSPLFKPDIITVKKRIESLMEREYFVRDNKDRETIRYVA